MHSYTAFLPIHDEKRYGFNENGAGGIMGALSGMTGGNLDMGSLMGKLKEGGLGGQVDSWMGDGENEPVSAEQLKSALGEELLRSCPKRYPALLINSVVAVRCWILQLWQRSSEPMVWVRNSAGHQDYWIWPRDCSRSRFITLILGVRPLFTRSWAARTPGILFEH